MSLPNGSYGLGKPLLNELLNPFHLTYSLPLFFLITFPMLNVASFVLYNSF